MCGRSEERQGLSRRDLLKAGARGTPTSYVNGQPVRGAKPLGHFEEVVAA